MDSLVTKLKTPSPHHKVALGDAGFTILPVDETDGALKDFQVVAEEALHYRGNAYQVMAKAVQPQGSAYCSIEFKQVRPE